MSIIGIAKYLEGRKGRKAEEERYGMPLKEHQIRQQMDIALQQAEREKARMAPGGVETKRILSAPYGIGVEEARPKTIPEGIGHRMERLQGTLAEKQIAGYETPAQTRAATGFETPAQQRTGEQDWEKKMAAIKQQYALELADLKGGAEEETIPFDESGAFNTQIFANIAGTLFPNYSFRDVHDNIGLEEVRKRIRFEAIANYGQNDPAKVKQIESSLDEWLRILFQAAESLPEEEKNQSFGEVLSKIGKFLITPLGGERGMTRREISQIPKLEEEGTLPGLDLMLPGAEQKDLISIEKGVKPERRGIGIPGLSAVNKRKYRSKMTPGIMTGH